MMPLTTGAGPALRFKEPRHACPRQTLTPSPVVALSSSPPSCRFGSVPNYVQNRLSQTSGHGKRLIDEIDLLTKEYSHDHSHQAHICPTNG